MSLNKKFINIKFAYIAIILLWFVAGFDGSWSELLKTNDQKAYGLFEDEKYKEASKLFESSMHKGAALFKGGEFKKAKAIYSTMSTKEARYNLGNSELMLGDYDKAIQAYDLALKIDPNFTFAKENRELAIVRKKMKEVENDGKQGIGDMYDMQPDEIVYDNNEGKGEDDERSTQKEIKGNTANWLDRIETSPKAFLKNKFSYQYQMKEVPGVIPN